MTNLEILKTLQNPPQDLRERLKAASDPTVLIFEIFQPIPFSEEEIRTKLLDDLKERYPNFDELYKDLTVKPELDKKIHDYCAAELAKEDIVKQIIAKIVELHAEIIKREPELEQSIREKAAIEERYWARYGTFRGKLGRSNDWGDFQQEMDAVNVKINEQKQRIEAFQKDINVGIAKLAIHYNCCNLTLDPDQLGMTVEIFGQKHHENTTDIEAYQRGLKFFDIKFESNTAFAAITKTIKDFEIVNKKKEFLQEFRSLDGYELIKDDAEFQQCIDAAVDIKLNISETESKEALVALQAKMQRMIILAKKSQEHKTSLLEEFQASFGHELITDAEWQSALQIMLAAYKQIDSDKGNEQVARDIIKEQKARLAEFIMERMSERMIYTEENLHVDESAIKKTITKQFHDVYGYADFNYMETTGSTNTSGIFGMVFNHFPNKFEEDEWISLYVRSIKYLATYNSTSIQHDTRSEVIKVQVSNSAARLKADTLPKAEPEKFNSTVAQLETDINRIEQTRLFEIQEIYKKHDARLQTLIKNSVIKKKSTEEVQIEIDQLVTETRDKLKTLDKRPKYIANKLYAENLELFGQQRFLLSSVDLSPTQLIEKFKTIVNGHYEEDQRLNKEFNEINITINSLKDKVQELILENQTLSRELVRLTTNVTAFDLQNNQSRINAIKSRLADIYTAQDDYALQLKELFVKRRSYQSRRAQLHAQIDLVKRQVMGMVPPAHPNFLAEYKGYREFLHNNINLEKFVTEIKALAKGDRASFDKLNGYVAEIISILPTLGVPDVADHGGLSHSQSNIDDLVKSFLILDQARQAVKVAVEKDPNNVYLKALREDIQYAFDNLSNKILIHPAYEAKIGFELLPEDKRIEYIKKAALIDTSTEQGRKSAEELNAEILWEITAIQHATAQAALDAQLNQMGPVGERIKSNLHLYNGLINHQVVLNELLLMQARIKEFLLNNDLSGDPAMKEAKQRELVYIEQEIQDMYKLMNTDLARVFNTLGVAVDKQDWGTFLMQEAQHYCIRGAYLTGGAVAGYGIGTIGGVVCNLLSKVTGYSGLGAVDYILPYFGTLTGAKIGYEAGGVATRYDHSNISAQLSSEDLATIEAFDNNFVSKQYLSSEELQKSLEAIKRNYIDRSQRASQGAMNIISNFFKDHPGVFWGAVGIIGIAVGGTLSAVAMGVASPVIIAAGVGAVATTYGISTLIGVVGAVVGGFWFKRKIAMPTAEGIYTDAMNKLKEVSAEINIPFEDFKKIQGDLSLKSLITNINIHFTQQLKLIEDRIKAHRSDNVDENLQDLLVRELYCLQEMQNVRDLLNSLLREINENQDSNLHITLMKREELATILEKHLNNNYQVYHRPHMVDLATEHTQHTKADLEKEMQERRKLKEQGRKHYITTAFGSSQEQTKVKQRIDREQAAVREMASISQQLNHLRQQPTDVK